uniref:Uncharacterized protein n=1 Tax=Arundo donax TaxID=35708 RepID=A0A0A9F475_ARUDO
MMLVIFPNYLHLVLVNLKHLHGN